MRSSVLAVMLLATGLASGCATMRSSRPLLPPDAQEAALRDLRDFSLRGRTGVKAGDEGFNASLAWAQRDQQTEVKLTGPFGAGGLTVTWSKDALRLASARGEVFEGGDAERVMIEQLGFVPPFEALRYWVLGLEAPGEPPTARTTGDNGRLGTLVQQQWNIRYRDWTEAATGTGAVAVPQRFIVTRDDVRLTVVVQKWQL
jgi:outer membrane lipoprotein LolB